MATIQRFVITLDANSARFARFRQANAHLRYEIFPAVRGADIPKTERINRGYITRECVERGLVTDGMLGCTISHWRLWSRAAAENVYMLIMEDDVFTHPAIEQYLTGLDDALGQHGGVLDFDIALLTANTDHIVGSVSPQGLQQYAVFEPKYPDASWIRAALAATDVNDVRWSRLLHAFGLCCYIVSPQGSRKMLQDVLPLRADPVHVPFLSEPVGGIGPDYRLNALYAGYRAYICAPFLAWTPNVDSTTA